MSESWLWYLDQVSHAATQQLDRVEGSSAGVMEFVTGAFHSLLEEELVYFQPSQLAAMLVGFESFVTRNTRRTLGSRVFNPDQDRDGWEAPRTVIEVLGEEDRKSVV